MIFCSLNKVRRLDGGDGAYDGGHEIILLSLIFISIAQREKNTFIIQQLKGLERGP